VTALIYYMIIDIAHIAPGPRATSPERSASLIGLNKLQLHTFYTAPTDSLPQHSTQTQVCDAEACMRGSKRAIPFPTIRKGLDIRGCYDLELV
jgi:hypothetical protein